MNKPSLTLVRRIKTTPAKLFAALSDPAQMARWMGPQGVESVTAEVDLRVGGRYAILMQAGGVEHAVSGTYREIVPGEKLVFTWAWRSTPERESLVTIAVRALPDGAELTLTHEQFFDEPARDRHQEGWVLALDRLVSLFPSGDPT